jgi:hypothetical protein
LATRNMLTVLSSAKAMCAQPVLGSIVSMLKSSRLQFEVGAGQKIPRLQMSPGVHGRHRHLGPGEGRLGRAQGETGRLPGEQVPVAGRRVRGRIPVAGPAQSPGRNFPFVSVGTISLVCSHPTATWPGLSAAMVGNTSVPAALTRPCT